MERKKEESDVEAIRQACFSNAESFLTVSESQLNKGVDHICFHLALLALEEVGKSILATIGFTIAKSKRFEKEAPTLIDDHVKKIFWALWSDVFFTANTFTKERITELRDMASDLHSRRLEYLYVDLSNPIPPKNKIGTNEAENLIKLSRNRLELERLARHQDDFTKQDIEVFDWFLASSENVEMRKFLFGSGSIAKLEELQNGRAWIKWLKEIADKNNEEMFALAQKEITRQSPATIDEKLQLKYKMRIKIQSISHHIKNDAFKGWNEHIEYIKLTKSNKKNLSNDAKAEIIIDFLFPKAVTAPILWGHSYSTAKIFVASLNIATRGLFWWTVQKNVDSFFEELTDIEASNKGDVKIVLTPSPRLSVDWGDLRLSLNSDDMRRVSVVFGYFNREDLKMKSFLNSYLSGMGCFSKTDIHLRLDSVAFMGFFNAFRNALIIHNDWDGKSSLIEAAQNVFKVAQSFNEMNETLELGLLTEQGKNPEITLTQVVGMKLYCDVYISMQAHKKLQEEQKVNNEA